MRKANPFKQLAKVAEENPDVMRQLLANIGATDPAAARRLANRYCAGCGCGLTETDHAAKRCTQCGHNL